MADTDEQAPAHPKVQGEEGRRADEFVPPDRADVIQPHEGDVVEEIDLGKPLAAKKSDEDEAPLRTEDGRRPGKRERADAEYSKDVQRRINREISLRKRVQAELAEERTARQSMEARLAALERVSQTSQHAATIQSLDAKIAELTKSLEVAIEAGNTKEQLRLQVELGDVQAERKILQRQNDETRAQAQQKPGGTPGGEPPREPRVQQWIHANRRWWNTDRWASAHNDAIEHDRMILAEIEDGTLDMERYSDEHFAELARRVRADYPDLDIRGPDGEPFGNGEDMVNARDTDEIDTGARPAPRNRPPQGGIGYRKGRASSPSEVELARRGKVQLTAEDYSQMRVFGLDPNNAQHKKYFAQERLRSIVRDGGGR